jgi:oxygen-independent coproporphyrinogen III oxidase
MYLTGKISNLMYTKKDNEFIAWYPPNLKKEDVESVWKPKNAAYYVHIPFCTAICDYCGFSVEKVKDANIAEYLECLKNEIKIYASKNRLANHRFICGHFGGGTPSVLDAKDLISIKDLIANEFEVDKDSEITVEINPISFTFDKAKEYFDAGINRISFGIQSFNNKTLKTIGRPHRSNDVYETIGIINSVGWTNFSIDLIYGVPGQSFEELEDDLKKAIESGASHISCFRLEIIPFTVLKLKEATNLLPLRKSIEELNEMDDIVSTFLKANGFNQYGAFNFAKPGYESIHNDIAFRAPQGEYIGFGNSSYSFINNYIYCNYADLENYEKQVRLNNEPISFAKKVTTYELMSRYFVLGIKFFKVPRIPFIQIFGFEPEKIFGEIFEKLSKNDLLILKDDHYCLTESGLHYVNNICKEFYVEESKGVGQFIQFVPNLTSKQISFYSNKFNEK